MPDGMVALMNSYEKYLSVDEVAGGTLQLRADSDEVGFRERFWVKIQNKYKKEANEEEKKKEGPTEPTNIDETGTKLVLFYISCNSWLIRELTAIYIKLGVLAEASSLLRTRKRFVELFRPPYYFF